MRFAIPALLCLFALAACGGAPAAKSYSYTMPDTPGGRLCTNACNSAHDYCKQACEFHGRECARDVQTQALEDYEKYAREQFAAHEPIELHGRDFERMSPCDGTQKSCTDSCESNMRACYEECGVKVELKTSCQFFCL